MSLALAILFGGYMLNAFKTNVFNNATINETYSTTFVENAVQKYNTSFDNMFLFVFILLNLSIVLSAFLIKSSPIFIVLFILAIIGIVLFSLIAYEIYSYITNTYEIHEISIIFPKVNWIMEHYGLLMGIISVIVLFALISNFGGEL